MASLRDAKGERILRATPSFQHERRCRGKLPPHHGSRRNGSDAAPGRTRRSAGTLQSSIHSTQAAHHRTPSLRCISTLSPSHLSKPATLILARTARMHPARLARLPTFTRSARCCPLSHSFPTASLLSTVSPYPVPSAGTPPALRGQQHSAGTNRRSTRIPLQFVVYGIRSRCKDISPSTVRWDWSSRRAPAPSHLT